MLVPERSQRRCSRVPQGTPASLRPRHAHQLEREPPGAGNGSAARALGADGQDNPGAFEVGWIALDTFDGSTIDESVVTRSNRSSGRRWPCAAAGGRSRRRLMGHCCARHSPLPAATMTARRCGEQDGNGEPRRVANVHPCCRLCRMDPTGLGADLQFRLLVEGVKDYAIFMLDTEGRVISWNAGAEQIKGYSAQEVIGSHFSRFYPAEAIERKWPQTELAEARRVGRFEDEGWRVRKDGSMFWANVIITALRGPDGELRGFCKITRDLTERKRQEESLRQSEERFRTLVEGVKDYAIFMLDPEGRVTMWNAGAERIKGYSAQEVIGTHFSRFYPAEAIERGRPEAVLAAARREGSFEDEGWRVRKDGSSFWASVLVTAIYGPSGELRGFSKITRDLSERKRLEQMESNARQMEEFVAMLAHELRNPLAPIANATSVLKLEGKDNAQVVWAAGLMERQLGQLVRLVDDLLDVSRITRGKIALESKRIDLADVVTRAAEASRTWIDAREQTLELQLPEGPLAIVSGDLARLTQVVSNLLHNAAKFTPPRGAIRVTVEADDAHAILRVRDNGVGISPELLPQVFDLFTQGDRGLDRVEGGLGLGLTIVRRLVELHGGTVQALSEGPGRGSEFIVRLPRLTRPLATPTAGAPATKAGRKLRILVVDDNRDSAESMALLLKRMGNDVHAVFDGPSALELAAQLQPDVVLLDIGMPGMTGVDVARALRRIPGLAGLSLFAMTGYGQESDRRMTREAGFDVHLVKPIRAEVLKQHLADIATRPGAG
ncbi:two-component hybrid sensor and regulator [Sorangium cellulosum So ce56]|uniref:histidine kinase n=2 Tax=Sorangium cellulosum TaxID=56 RepID=A9EUB8_SORC5|nr:two-component hybrid sensor and regulator [Sorangium cellulosum So ce56]